MQSELQGIDLDALLAEMPTPLVVLDMRSRSLVYANHAAQRLPFAYQELAGWQAVDADGNDLVGDAVPYRAALLGASCHRRLVHYHHGESHYALLFHCHKLDANLCVLTFDDVTSFDDVQRQLREAITARDELVSMAAHELRSPLGALQLVAERIARKAADMPAEELRKVSETAMRQTSRLSILVGNLLDVSRMRAGKFELDLEMSSLGDIVREACEPLADQAHAAGTSLTVDISDACLGMWDRVRMEQVVTNLVTNAIKYGGGTEIRVALDRPSASQVFLRVEDGGCGIPPDEQARIFEPFARASRRHNAQSLGLGLFIVRGIVEAHGGEVGLECTTGKTVFTTILPVR